MSPKQFSELHTPGGYLVGEVTSALQKAIRRGEEREAIFWATELDLTGYANYAFKRLRIIASEDVGLAEPDAAVAVRALYDNFLDARKDSKDPGSGMLFLVHAVILLARARKTREVDHACVIFYQGDRAAMGYEIPDHALDIHTARGRKLGRGNEHFYDQAGQLANRGPGFDLYEDEAREIDSKPPAANARAGEVTKEQLALLHVLYGQLDERAAISGVLGHAYAMKRASEQFGKLFSSSSELSSMQAGWLIRTLKDELAPKPKRTQRTVRS